MFSFKIILLLYAVFAALFYHVSAARISDKAGAWTAKHFDTAIDDLEELSEERSDSASVEDNRLDKDEHHARHTFHKFMEKVKENDLVKHMIAKGDDLLENAMDKKDVKKDDLLDIDKHTISAQESDKLSTLEDLMENKLDCDDEEFTTQWKLLEHLLSKLECPFENRCKNDKKDNVKHAAGKTLKLGKIVDFFIGKAFKQDAMDLVKDSMKLRLSFHKKDKGTGKKVDLKEFLDKVIGIGTKILKLEEKHQKESEENEKHVFEHLKDKAVNAIHGIVKKHEPKDHEDFFSHIKEIGKKMHKMIKKHERHGAGDIKDELLENIKGVAMKIFKIDETYDKKEGIIHISKFLPDLKAIEHKIHEIKKKHKGREGKHHKGLLKYIDEVGIKIHDILDKHHLKGIGEKILTVEGIAHETKHVAEKGKELEKKLVESIKHFLEKNKLLHKIDDIPKHAFEKILKQVIEKEKKHFKLGNEGDFIEHLFEKVLKHHKKEGKGEFIKDTIKNGKKMFEHAEHLVKQGNKKHNTFAGFEHIIEELIKQETHNRKHDEKDEGHFFRQIKEVGEKIHDMIHKHKQHTEESNHDLLQHIKKIGTKILKIGEIYSKIGDKVHISEFLPDLKEIKTGIHEIKEKYEKKQVEKHKDLFKYIEEVHEKIHHVLDKHDKIKRDDHKGDLLDLMKRIGEKLQIAGGTKHETKKLKDKVLVGGIKDVIEKGKELEETLLESIKDILEKNNILHKIEHEEYFPKHVLEKLFKHNKKEKGEISIIDEIKHIIEKEKKHHKIEKDGDFIKHAFEKIFKHDKKSGIGEFIKDTIENGKTIVEGGKHIVEEGIKIDSFKHIIEELLKHNGKEEGDKHFFKHIKEIWKIFHGIIEKYEEHGDKFITGNLFHHIKEIEMKIFKIVKVHGEKGEKVHIGHFLHDLKEIVQKIDEVKEKYEEKEEKVHKDLFKFIGVIGKKLYDIIKKHDKLIGEDHKGKFLHLMEGVGEHHKGEFIEDTIKIEKKLLEEIKKAIKKGTKIDGFKHVMEKLMKHHKIKHEGEFIKHLFEKVGTHHSKDVVDDDGHFFKHIKEIGKIFHELIKKHEKHGDKFIKGNLFHHIKEIGMKIFKIVEVHDEKGGKVHIGHFLHNLEEIVKKIHEVKDKYEEIDHKVHEDLFKFIGDIGEKLYDVMKKHGTFIGEDHKEIFLHLMKGVGEHHKGDFIEGTKEIEKKLLEDIKKVIKKGTKIDETVDGFKHIMEKLMKHHKIKHEGEFIKDLFEKVGKHYSKDVIDDDGHFFKDIKEIGKIFHELIKKHEEHGDKFIKANLFRHIQEIGMKIFKIVEVHDEKEGTVHIGHFLHNLKDIVNKIHEVKEKYEEIDHKVHKDLFKFIGDIGEKLYDVIKKHDKFIGEDHKEIFLHLMKGAGEHHKGDFIEGTIEIEKKIFGDIKKVIEKGTKIDETVDGFKDVIEKLIEHNKIKHEGDFFEHIIDSVFKHDKEDIKEKFLEETIGFGKKIVEDIKHGAEKGAKAHIIEKQNKLHELENGKDFMKHVFEKVFTHDKKDDVHVIENTLKKGKKLVEGFDHILEGKKELEKLLLIDGIKHLIEKGKNLHEIGYDNFIKYLFDKHVKHNNHEDKEEFIEEKLEDGKKLVEGVKHIIEKEKDTIEKLVEGFKHSMEGKNILLELEKGGEIIKHVIKKEEFVKDAIEEGKKLVGGFKFVVDKGKELKTLAGGFKHIIEKEKEAKEEMADEFKHIIDKGKLLHKLDHEHMNEKEFIGDVIGKKKLIEGFGHIEKKEKKLHEFENDGHFIKHVFHKVFEQNTEGGKEDIKEKVKEKENAFKCFLEKEIKDEFEDGKDKIKELILHELGKKIHEVENIQEFIEDVLHKKDAMLKIISGDIGFDGKKNTVKTFLKLIGSLEDQFKEKGVEFVGAKHEGDFIKHLLEGKFEHGKDKIKELFMHELGKKIHEVENMEEFIKEFIEDVLHKKDAMLKIISGDIGSDGKKNAVNTFLKLIGSLDIGKHAKHDGNEKEEILSKSKHMLDKVSKAIHAIGTPLSHSAAFLKKILPEKKVVDCCPCECCCCGYDGDNNNNQGFTYKKGDEFVELYSNPNVHDQGYYFG